MATVGIPAHVEVPRRLRAGERTLFLDGGSPSYLALILARVAADPGRPGPLLCITVDDESARRLARDLTFFLGSESAHPALDLPPVLHLPEVETSPYADTAYDRAAVMQRQGVLFRLSQGFEGRVLLASARALRARVMPRPELSELCDLVVSQDELDREAFIERLVACGFRRVQVVEDPGTFAVRGGILDLYPPLAGFPLRLELYGDLVESLRLFDPASQRTLREVPEVMVYPVRETVRTGGADLRAAVLQAADAQNHPSSKTRALLEELESGREFFGIEGLMPVFHRRLASLVEYLPADGAVALLDPEGLWTLLRDEDDRATQGFEARIAAGRLALPPSAFFLSAEEVRASLEGRPTLLMSVAAASDEAARVSCQIEDNADLAAELARGRSQRGEAVLGPLAQRMTAWLEEGRPVMVAAGGRGQVDRLDSLLRGHGVRTASEREEGRPQLLDQEPAPEAVELRPGSLGQGFRVPGGLVVIGEREIFGEKSRRGPPARFTTPGIGDLRDLREGDYIVHAEHGVGLYLGLAKLEIRGVPSDFLYLEFAAGGRLYLPVYRMNQVQKYVGAEGQKPRLDRLGGSTWSKKKSKVRLEVRKLAEELLQIYAQRASQAGHAFPEGDAAYEEFEATFPFEATPDQARAIAEVIGDLTSPRPMDRLVCGDVGFGKTEVALRAAFLVANSGKQVAVLAPTTVLVEQHLRSFTDRMGPYPLRVESLSRFRSASELHEVLRDLAQGRVDIVIGTHRLLSSDVRFKDLGLVIVDEEQRFGVAHKEKLRRLRTQLDMLTLTATPIPRTLQMGLTGMREISVISTPPVDRLAIRTFVSRFDEAQVAEGIRKELDRGGQVFFVHNRVQSIDEWAVRIAALVPEARVAVAHGQMESSRLERVMLDFVSHRFDVLCCTAIIESGLDIPRANTMFINRADCFGLSQLYQLRGRIGRSRDRAFCHLLVPGFETLTTEARQRLLALQRFTELGSGFSVASHDLEIRGAGDLLGARQSGHIAEVGFETYTRILEEAVAELRGEPIHRETDPEINSPLPAYIPDDHVEDMGQRLDLYRRLSQAAMDEQAVADVLSEMRDRYGQNPPEVEALGQLMVLRGLAARLGAQVVDLAETRIALTLSEATPLDPDRLVALIGRRGSGFRLTPEMRLLRTLTEAEQRDPLESATLILRDLWHYASTPLPTASTVARRS